MRRILATAFPEHKLMALPFQLQSLINRITAFNIAGVLILLPIVGLIVGPIVYEVARWSARVPSFDGPRGLPIVGNLWQIKGKDAPEQYRMWSKKYGGLYQIQLGSVPVLVINTAAAAKAVLSQNSQATSSRPEFYTFHKVISDTSATTIGTSPYTDSLKRRRKATASALNKTAVQSYIPLLDEETKVFLLEALRLGKAGKAAVNPRPIFLRLNLSVGLSLNYGARMESQSDLFREIVYVEDMISNFRSTTSNLQDYIPLLRWRPTNPVSKEAREMSVRRAQYIKQFDRDLDARIEKSTEKPCIRVNALRDEEAKLNDKEMMSLNLTMLAAGLDTMNSAVGWGIAMLADNLDVQEKAVKAIREIYPENQPLCDAKDDQNCQYIVILVKEILRFYTVTRLSLPRRTIRDFVYEDKRIPAGTVIFLNAWACNMDPALWDDPEVFRPERWLEQPEAPIFTFGIGSRMCVGMQLAYRELYVLYLRMLNSFSIERVGDIETHPIRGVEDRGALTTQPKKYEVRFIPRNLEALQEALSSVKV